MLRQELLKHKGIRVSLRTVERAVQAWREALRKSRQAIRYETRPGLQLQADFGELWVLIGGVRTKVHLWVMTLGYSRRQVVRVPAAEAAPLAAGAGGGVPDLGWFA